MSIGNKIVYEINRPDKKLVELFREMPVANIDDNMGRIAAVDAAIRPMNRALYWAQPLQSVCRRETTSCSTKLWIWLCLGMSS